MRIQLMVNMYLLRMKVKWLKNLVQVMRLFVKELLQEGINWRLTYYVEEIKKKINKLIYIMILVCKMSRRGDWVGT